MSATPPRQREDIVLPFQLDRSDTRGRIARLDGVLEGILRQHTYPAPVEALVAEMALLTALIGQTIKLRWKLSLQLQAKGAVRRVVTDYYAPEREGAPARIRAYASFDETRIRDDIAPLEQIEEGYFAILMDQGEGTTPYQGITPLSGNSLSASAEAYFAQSEQLPTRFALSFGRSSLPGEAEHWRAGGIMVQTMPPSSQAARPHHLDSDGWNRTKILLDTVEDLELIGPSVTPEGVLLRLFHEEIPRVFPAQPVEFGCTCSAKRVRESLSIYSAKDIARMTTPEGRVTADCQFCGAHYTLDPATLGFEAEAPGDG